MEIDNLTFSFDKVLDICMVVNFAHFFCCLHIFFQKQYFQKKFHSYHQCQIVGIEIRTDNFRSVSKLFGKVISRRHSQANNQSYNCRK